MTVRLTRGAQRQLDRILLYIAEHDPGAASGVLSALERSIAMLGDHSDLGRPADVRGVRVLTVGRYPYRIFYTARGGDVTVIAVRHTSRRPLRSRS